MKAYTKALIALTLVTIVTFGVLVGVGVSNGTFGETGLKPFDLRMAGYTLSEAQTYVASLTAEQATQYAGFQRHLYRAFSLMLGLWMGWSLWGLTQSLYPWSRLILLVVPASYTVMDLCENALIFEIISKRLFVLDPDLVDLASRYTITKFVMLLVAFGLLLAMMFRKAGLGSEQSKG